MSTGRAALVGVLAGVAGALLAGAPAQAHGGDAPNGTDYRTVVTAVSPTVDGLTVRTVEAGARLELRNRTGRTIEVLGYQGEPYLEVRPDGVYENVRSPATYLNVSLAGDNQPPPNTADATRPPQWRKTSDEPVARWHDHRTHWMTAAPPPQVAADPTRPHRIRDWTVPLRDGTGTVTVHGTLDWQPPPMAALWWAATLLTAAVVGALGSLAAGRAATGNTLAVLAVAGGLVAVGYAVAREVDAGAAGPGAFALGLLLGQVWTVLTGLTAVAAGVFALAGRQAGDFALALAGVCLAAFAGLPNVAVFGRAIAPIPGPAWSARLMVLAVVGIGAGLAAAGVLRLGAASRAAAAAADPTQPPQTDPTQPPQTGGQ
ncbi:MAG TPA: hypothetical protein VF755_15695 [Catenuloplanes sp.]|jgi:hypothetical protein